MNMSDVELKRINMQLPKWQIELVDEYARKMNMSRTSVFSLIISEWFKQQETIGGLGTLVKLAEEQEKQK